MTIRKRTKVAAVLAGIFVLAIAVAGIAALLTQADVQVSATSANRTLDWSTVSATQTDGALTTDVVGDGTCTANVVNGELVVSYSGFWNGSECSAGFTGGNAYVIAGEFPTTVVGFDFTGAPDFGDLGNGTTALEVELRDSNGDPMPLPWVLASSATFSGARVHFTVNGLVADPGVAYSGTFGLAGG